MLGPRSFEVSDMPALHKISGRSESLHTFLLWANAPSRLRRKLLSASHLDAMPSMLSRIAAVCNHYLRAPSPPFPAARPSRVASTLLAIHLTKLTLLLRHSCPLRSSRLLLTSSSRLGKSTTPSVSKRKLWRAWSLMEVDAWVMLLHSSRLACN